MENRFTFFAIALMWGITSSIYGQKSFTDRDFSEWSRSAPDAKIGIAHTIYLLGELGGESEVAFSATLELLAKQTKMEGARASILFMGNFFPEALLGDADFSANVEARLQNQLAWLSESSAQAYFIPGNRDWLAVEENKLESLEELGAMIEGIIGDEDAWYPEDACGDPRAIELADGVVLIIVDSQWYIDHLDVPTVDNDDCKVDNIYEYQAKLVELLDEYDDDHIILASHHPLKSGGPYGGFSSWKDHVVPFPLVGSLIGAAKVAGITEQFLTHPKQKAFQDLLLDATAQVKDVVFTAAHDKGLQYFEDTPSFALEGVVKANRHFIGSGSAVQGGYVRNNSGVDFAYRGEGFAKLIYLENGATWLEMWKPNEEGEGQLLFRLQLKQRYKVVSGADMMPKPLNAPDSMSAKADPFYEGGIGKRRWLGDTYRDAWIAEVKWPTLNLSKSLGGLKPVKKGGGIQTKSLRLIDSIGQEYVLRSVAKDVSLLVPDEAENTILQDVVQDGLSMAHPYGALVVPPLAEAAGVYHTDPQFFFVPKQDALGDYHEDFANGIYLLERRPEEPSGRKADELFDEAEEITSTAKMLRELSESNLHQIDQKEFLRARLFDIYLGDWDRHEDQWRWIEEEEGESKSYTPIPRDRDQVFLAVDGILPWLLTRDYGIRMLQNFDSDIRDIAGLNINARHLDRALLNQQSKEDWIAMAEDIQKCLSETVIEEAIQLWPDTIYHFHGESIIEKLKDRKENLPQFAERYYTYLAQIVNIVGSEDREYFVVERLANSDTQVQMYRMNEKGDKEELLYERVMKEEETKEIRLYGLKGDDRFQIQGQAHKGSLIRVVGGPGEDIYEDQSTLGGGKSIYLYDTEEGNEIIVGKETKDKRSDHPSVNEYDYEAYQLNSYLPLINGGFNQDDGFLLGAGITVTRRGFRKEPYKAKHTLTGRAAFTTGGAQLVYTGDFVAAFGNSDLSIEADGNTPLFTINFFGLGNETIYTEEFDEEFDINRVRLSRANFFPSIKRTFNEQVHTLKLGPLYQYTHIENSTGRFVASEEANLSPDVFDAQHYGGLRFRYQLDTRDNIIVPRRGFLFHVGADWLTELDDTDNGFVNIQSELAVYHYIKAPLKMILASRVGYSTIVGGPFEFFQANTLGRFDNLRGFRRNRFAGEDAFFHNIDLRVPLYSVKNYYLPFELGIVGFFDHGRVWLDGEDSDTWHYGYGGGIVIRPYSLNAITISYDRSEEFDIISFQFGFLF